MPSNEPIEPRYGNDPDRAIASSAWRAEVASRVCSYRAQRRRKNAGENAPALDFGPAARAQTFCAPDSPAQNPVSRDIGAGIDGVSGVAANPPTEARKPDRNANDTNYYRRLNAESMAQSASVALGEAVAALVPAEERNVESGSLLEGGLAADDPALDLEIRPTLATDSFLERYCISAPQPEPEPESVLPAAPVPGNLIVFPRPLLEPPLLPLPCRDELAEPMHSRPRILEVPEDIMPVVQGSLFPEIRLDGDVEEGEGRREPEFDVPPRVAPVSARLMAGLTDLGLVMAAGLIFAGMAWRALPDVPHAKPFWAALGVVTLLLWAVYQHLFLLYAGRTPGMRMRGIRLSAFDGQPPSWKQRRRRARFMVISFAAVMLGFLWALVDEDALCWHDRISRTFPTTE